MASARTARGAARAAAGTPTSSDAGRVDQGVRRHQEAEADPRDEAGPVAAPQGKDERTHRREGGAPRERQGQRPEGEVDDARAAQVSGCPEHVRPRRVGRRPGQRHADQRRDGGGAEGAGERTTTEHDEPDEHRDQLRFGRRGQHQPERDPRRDAVRHPGDDGHAGGDDHGDVPKLEVVEDRQEADHRHPREEAIGQLAAARRDGGGDDEQDELERQPGKHGDVGGDREGRHGQGRRQRRVEVVDHRPEGAVREGARRFQVPRDVGGPHVLGRPHHGEGADERRDHGEPDQCRAGGDRPARGPGGHRAPAGAAARAGSCQILIAASRITHELT